MTTSAASNTQPHSLKDRLEASLPTGFNCSIRYIHSTPKPCEPLCSALPGQEAEKTRLASHFFTVSVNPNTLSHLGGSVATDASGDVISFAIEVLAYSTKRLTTIFVSKVDSTPFIPRIKPSPIKTSVTTILKWLANEELRKHPKRKVVISLFARAQAQYLFPGSADDKTKHVLDDRQLIKWWARVLDPIFPETSNDDTEYQAYITVPGYSKHELKSFMPPNISSSETKPRWVPGNPLPELARTRGLPEHAPPRCLLPRFPDDPKARFMTDLDEEIGISQDAQVHVSPSKRKSGRWNSVRDLERFWESMEFRQECSSGRAVGFLWLVIAPRGSEIEQSFTESFNVVAGDSQNSTTSLELSLSSDPISQSSDTAPTNGSPRKRRRKPLTGPIIPRQPRLKGGSSSVSNLSEMQSQLDAAAGEGIVVTKDGYDKTMHTMLNLDFGNMQIAARSTIKWIAEVTNITGLNGDFAVPISGKAQVEVASVAATANGAPAVNDLGGMIRKKRKAVDNPTAEGQAGAEKGMGLGANEHPVVNVLGAGTIRKKPKP